MTSHNVEFFCNFCNLEFYPSRSQIQKTYRKHYCSKKCEGLGRKLPLKTKFWRNVKIGNHDKCWEWQLSKAKWGYGITDIDGKNIHAHRVAWILTHGEIPWGIWVLHHCDNPPCCNPAHLFLGTPKDNTRDMWDKGRASQNCKYGSEQHKAKLNDIDIPIIIELYKNGMTQKAIANHYNVTRQSIGHIISGKGWRHIGREKFLQSN